MQPETVYQQSNRPTVALITNHGYGGVEIPLGGAPDTGGQNQYVNSLARALDQLGYRVTIFARGGFPYYESQRLRQQAEYMSDHIRYVFVPGGGEKFIRKEDIAIALDEQIQWLDLFIREEARTAGCAPWEVYQFLNSHYWDAAIIGMRLVERWRDDVAAKSIAELLGDAFSRPALTALHNERHWQSVGGSPGFHIGRLLLECGGPATTGLVDRVRQSAQRLSESRCEEPEHLVEVLVEAAQTTLQAARQSMAPVLQEIAVADAIGAALLEWFPEQTDDVRQQLDEVDRHVWTPHSLGSLKDHNFQQRPVEIRRALKFCERRSHERTVCDGTRMFVATSEEIALQLRTSFGVPADQIFYFPPCVDPDEFRPRQPSELQATYRYLSEMSGIPIERLRTSKVVFETSRMDQTKRKDLLLDAFSRVAARRDDVILVIGGGPEQELYQSLVAQRDADPQLVGRALITGYVPEEHIGPLFSLADLYVSASEMEGFGMSALQAAASGTALVASDLTPFAIQYVPDSAVVVRSGDVDAFAHAIQQLLDDDSDRQKRTKQLLEQVEALHWTAQTLKFLKHLETMGILNRRESMAK